MTGRPQEAQTLDLEGAWDVLRSPAPVSDDELAAACKVVIEKARDGREVTAAKMLRLVTRGAAE